MGGHERGAQSEDTIGVPLDLVVELSLSLQQLLSSTDTALCNPSARTAFEAHFGAYLTSPSALLRLDHSLDPLDPADNARMATRYLRHLLGRTDNDLRQALIAYNQGLGALRRNGPYPEAQRYADRVLALRPMFTTGP